MIRRLGLYCRSVSKRRKKHLAAAPSRALLHEDVQRDPVLIQGTPEIVLHSSNPDEHLIQVPGIPRSGACCALARRLPLQRTAQNEADRRLDRRSPHSRRIGQIAAERAARRPRPREGSPQRDVLEGAVNGVLALLKASAWLTGWSADRWNLGAPPSALRSGFPRKRRNRSKR